MTKRRGLLRCGPYLIPCKEASSTPRRGLARVLRRINWLRLVTMNTIYVHRAVKARLDPRSSLGRIRLKINLVTVAPKPSSARAESVPLELCKHLFTLLFHLSPVPNHSLTNL